MKSLIQRVSEASVSVDGQEVSRIGPGILVLLGIEKPDELSVVKAQAEKLLKFRIFSDEAGKMNQSVVDIQGEILVVSQFTLAADCRKGNRPGFDGAKPPQEAEALYEAYVKHLQTMSGLIVQTGVFGAKMAVSLINDGPATFLLEA